eukprot:contig_21621_g5342
MWAARSTPSSREASSVGEEMLLRDSSTIRDSASIDSQLSVGTVPRPRPLLHWGAGPEGSTDEPDGANEGTTALQADGARTFPGPSRAVFLPDAVLIVPREEDDADEAATVLDDDDVGSEVVIFFRAPPCSTPLPTDAPVSLGLSLAPRVTGPAAANPSPPLSAGAASLSTASALSTPLSDGTDDLNGWGASVSGSGPSVGPTSAVSVVDEEDLRVALSADASGLTGPLVRLSRLRLGPYRGSLQDVVVSYRKKAQRAAEKAAFPIRGSMAASRGSQEGNEATSPAIPIRTASRIGNRINGTQEFELWYRTELPVVDADGKSVLQVVKIRVRVEASVVEDTEQCGALVGFLRVVDVDLGVDSQLAIVGRDGPGRVLGYYLDRLSVLVAAVPPPDSSVVVKDVGGQDGPNAAVDGVSRITHGTVESRERTLNATVGIGGEAGLIPSLALQAQQTTSRTNDVSAEMSRPAWKWTGSIRQRERTADTVAPLGCGVRNAPDP